MPDPRLRPLLDDPAAARVLALLCDNGHRAWIVGGAVRDALLGKPIGDIDVTTDAEPSRVMDLAGAAGLRAIPTGLDHGTVTVLAPDAIEVTTLRRDVETFGRHATVAFGTDPSEDAQRRDFTVNALYLAPDGTLLDPTVGLPDLAARRIRFVGHASTRIREDYLRSLRYFRFHAWHGDPAEGLDPDALDAIARNLDGLDTLSRERMGTRCSASSPPPTRPRPSRPCAITGALARSCPGAATGSSRPSCISRGRRASPSTPCGAWPRLGGEEPAERAAALQGPRHAPRPPRTSMARPLGPRASSATAWARRRRSTSSPSAPPCRTPSSTPPRPEAARTGRPSASPSGPPTSPPCGSRAGPAPQAWSAPGSTRASRSRPRRSSGSPEGLRQKAHPAVSLDDAATYIRRTIPAGPPVPVPEEGGAASICASMFRFFENLVDPSRRMPR
jgi:hypothetical protein